MKKLTQAEFIAKAVAVHGVGRYDYSRAVYGGRIKLLTIVCPSHGMFNQLPAVHWRGGGCPKCGDLSAAKGNSSNASDFITKAQAVHGVGTYDYSLVRYKGYREKVSIICPKHGVFKQRPEHHALGVGCQICGKVKVALHAESRKYTTADFITKAQAVHGERYDYSQAEYERTHVKLSIICQQHGSFNQAPIKHLAGQGCPQCRLVAMRLGWVAQAKGRQATLYLLKVYSETESFYKVGITFRSVNKRFNDKKALNGYLFEILAMSTSANVSAVYDWEQAIIKSFAHLRYKPERRFGGATECFNRADEILAIFPL